MFKKQTFRNSSFSLIEDHADPQDQYEGSVYSKKKKKSLGRVSAHITPWDLKLAKFVEQLQVLRHGVNAVRWCKQSLGLCRKNRRQLRDVGTEERLHELLHKVPAIPRNHAGTILHLREHSES